MFVLPRVVCSLSDNDRDTEEDFTDERERFRPEKMHSDSTKLKKRLSELRHVREVYFTEL